MAPLFSHQHRPLPPPLLPHHPSDHHLHHGQVQCYQTSGVSKRECWTFRKCFFYAVLLLPRVIFTELDVKLFTLRFRECICDTTVWAPLLWLAESDHHPILPHPSAVVFLCLASHHRLLFCLLRSALDPVWVVSLVSIQLLAKIVDLFWMFPFRSIQNRTTMHKCYTFLIFMVLLLPSLGLSRYFSFIPVFKTYCKSRLIPTCHPYLIRLIYFVLFQFGSFLPLAVWQEVLGRCESQIWVSGRSTSFKIRSCSFYTRFIFSLINVLWVVLFLTKLLKISSKHFQKYAWKLIKETSGVLEPLRV